MRFACVIASLVLCSLLTAAEPTPPKGFTALFNGKDLTGWHGMPHFNPYDLDKLTNEKRKAQVDTWTADAAKHWSVDKYELVNDGNGAYLTTDKDYGDIEFLVEYKTVALADSGIYLRATPQIQIWDYTKEGGKWNLGADKGSGGLWNNSPGAPGKDPLVLADKPFGEWNAFRILMVGERVAVYLNGKLVVDAARLENFWDKKLPLRKRGPIQLQTHGGEIRWRNMFIREIPAAEANEFLRKRDAAEFKDIFNGTDFAGWAGALDGYEVKDGAIINRPGKGGNIFTQHEYDDFVARVEYKMPAGGNNGLAIRYPGKGQASVDAMCEVQVLDDNASKHAKLDALQYNGSVYGMIAAHRGYDRALSDWNLMEVTVKGHQIQVELNGTRIVDGDVSKVTEFLDNKKHPGKDLLRGHFGFCGHNDPVAFRNIQVKELK
ncbi:MAG TPA: DUF1080 domain-containing protein [Gemmataceae bacterium]|jgi:hypothetical protein|nr:DUF1080 domain-containing protein [Gemmataceae bacterium]